MSKQLQEIQALLLDLLSTHRDVAITSITTMSDGDWSTLLGLVLQHRLGPLLYWRLTRERAGIPVPSSLLHALENQFNAMSLRSLKLQRELLLVHDLLEKAHIPHVALKGSYLALFAYPHAALRPMRDLDILVPDEQAIQAFQILIDNGFQRIKESQGELEFILKHGKHLPGVYSVARITIELHARLASPNYRGVSQPELTDDQSIWCRLIHREIGGKTLNFFSPTDLLLHLICHATYDHQFDNGPLVLSDIHYLLNKHTIDWPQFWHRAFQEKWHRGCLLTLKMAEYYYGNLNIEFSQSLKSEDEISDKFIKEASLLTLRNFAHKHEVHLLRLTGTNQPLIQKLSYLFKLCFPPQQYMADNYNVKPSSFLIYYFYIYRFIIRVSQTLTTHGDRKTKDEARQLAKVDSWLRA